MPLVVVPSFVCVGPGAISYIWKILSVAHPLEKRYNVKKRKAYRSRSGGKIGRSPTLQAVLVPPDLPCHIRQHLGPRQRPVVEWLFAAEGY